MLVGVRAREILNKEERASSYTKRSFFWLGVRFGYFLQNKSKLQSSSLYEKNRSSA